MEDQRVQDAGVKLTVASIIIHYLSWQGEMLHSFERGASCRVDGLAFRANISPNAGRANVRVADPLGTSQDRPFIQPTLALATCL